MGAAIGIRDRVTDISTVCMSEWNRYKEEIGECKPDWEIILDDSRRINVNTTASDFSGHASEMIKNLFLGCNEVVSLEIHDQFVETIVKRIKEITEYDWEHHKEKDPFNQVIKLYRSTEDLSKERQTELLFVMVIRITALSTNWESCVKLQLRSHKVTPVGSEPSRPRCCENQNQYLLDAVERSQEQLLLDPT